MDFKAGARTRVLIVVFVMALLFSALIPLAAAAPTKITSLSPTSGFVGDTVRLVGQIDTFGGGFRVKFDTGAGVVEVTSGTAPPNSLLVDTSFMAPDAIGNDAGLAHAVTLQDNATGGSDSANFAVRTQRIVSATGRVPGEGLNADITVMVTGGIAITPYSYSVDVIDPSGASHRGSVSLTTGPAGTGSGTVKYPGQFPAASGANTNFVGTYGIIASETAPGTVPGPRTSFLTGLTDATAYQRFKVINIRSSGWKNGEEVLVDIKLAGQSVQIGRFPAYPVTAIASSAGLVTNVTDMLPVDIATGSYSVSVANSTGKFSPTVKSPADLQSFDVKASTGITVQLIQQPSPTPIQRTLTAIAKLRILYADGSVFTPDRLGSITVSVLNNSGVNVADIALAASNFDRTPNIGLWNVSWHVPKGAELKSHTFRVGAAAVMDKNGNSGPLMAVKSNALGINAAQLAVTITGQWTAGFVFNRTETVAMKFKVAYPDKSLFSAADLGFVIVNVTSSALTFHIANLTLGSSDFNAATSNWTARWTVPFDAAVGATQYTMLIRNASRPGIVDQFMNSNALSAATQSRAFMAKQVLLSVPSLGTDKASYERDQTVVVFFRATYLDGSPVTTGTAPIVLTKPDGTTETLTSRFVEARGRFEATRILNVLDPLGAYSAKLGINGLRDGAVPANAGPDVAQSVSFQVVRAVQVIQVNADAGSEYFAGETAQFTVLTANRGTPIDVDSITASLIRPDGSSAALTPQRVAVGVFTVRFALASDASPGTYTLVVSASVVLPDGTQGMGTTLKSFQVSKSLSDLNANVRTIMGTLTSIQNGIATIQTSIGTLQISVSSLDAHLTRIDGSIATIQTSIGTLQTSVSNLDAKVVALKGDVATVQTSVGTLQGTVTSVQGDVATIKTNVGTINAKVPENIATTPSISNVLNLLYVVTALALIGALGAIAAVAVISRRLTK